jgi:hypothetical protein
MVFDFLPSASHLIIFRLEVIFMDYANYHLGIGVAIASIAIVIALAISNPWFFLASIALLIGLECLK